MSGGKGGPPRKVDYEDVDDIIGIAAELKSREADQLSVAELESVGRELDIPADYVRRAIDELEKRRATDRRRIEEQSAKKRLLRKRLIIGVAALVGLLLLWGVIAQSSLRSSLAEVQARRAQVKNVIERQQAVLARYGKRPPSRERDAMLDGAENRVRIERMRYDQLAARYNAKAGSFPNSLWARLFGLPGSVPLSSSVKTW